MMNLLVGFLVTALTVVAVVFVVNWSGIFKGGIAGIGLKAAQ